MIERSEFHAGRIVLYRGDCLEALAQMPENSIESCVCDPPYHLQSIVARFAKTGRTDKTRTTSGPHQRTAAGFMNKQWDGSDVAFRKETWEAVYRVLKPGAYLLAFGGTRTYHRMACAIEDAGFVIYDQIGWTYGSGFPKSHNIGKAIDKMRGAERPVIGVVNNTYDGANRDPSKHGNPADQSNIGEWGLTKTPHGMPMTAPGSAEAAQWEGWGTALKPAWEPICVARKPLGSPAVDVKYNIESQLRERGAGEIRWTNSVNAAAKASRAKNSSSTQAPRTAETSADLVEVNETKSDAPQIQNQNERDSALGMPQISNASSNIDAISTADCENKSSTLMGTSVPVATNLKNVSSPSIISTAEATNTENQITAKFTPNCADEASPTDTESFAEIATGLTGSMASVLIRRMPDGSFVWPHNLPEYVPAENLTIAENVLKWGTGALNIDACRVETNEPQEMRARNNGPTMGYHGCDKPFSPEGHAGGRWPANVIHDGSEEVLAEFPELHGHGSTTHSTGAIKGMFKQSDAAKQLAQGGGESGSAARFFYTAKADADDRLGSKHPTVKPLDLMQYLVRLVTRKGGTTLDPFAGTGTTGEAALREGCNAVLCEREPEYQADIERRMNLAGASKETRKVASIKAKGKTPPINDLPLFGGDAA